MVNGRIGIGPNARGRNDKGQNGRGWSGMIPTLQNNMYVSKTAKERNEIAAWMLHRNGTITIWSFSMIEKQIQARNARNTTNKS